MECLETNKICSNTNKKCKECKLDLGCKKVFEELEAMQDKKIKSKEEKLREECECGECPHLQIIDVDKQEVRCFYKIDKECVLDKEKG